MTDRWIAASGRLAHRPRPSGRNSDPLPQAASDNVRRVRRDPALAAAEAGVHIVVGGVPHHLCHNEAGAPEAPAAVGGVAAGDGVAPPDVAAQVDEDGGEDDDVYVS